MLPSISLFLVPINNKIYRRLCCCKAICNFMGYVLSNVHHKKPFVSKLPTWMLRIHSDYFVLTTWPLTAVWHFFCFWTQLSINNGCTMTTAGFCKIQTWRKGPWPIFTNSFFNDSEYLFLTGWCICGFLTLIPFSDANNP